MQKKQLSHSGQIKRRMVVEVEVKVKVKLKVKVKDMMPTMTMAKRNGSKETSDFRLGT